MAKKIYIIVSVIFAAIFDIVLSVLALKNIVSWKVVILTIISELSITLIVYVSGFLVRKFGLRQKVEEKIAEVDPKLWERKAINESWDKWFAADESRVNSTTITIGGSSVICVELEDIWKESPDYRFWYYFFNTKSGKVHQIKSFDKIPMEKEGLELREKYANLLSDKPITSRVKVLEKFDESGKILKETTPIEEKEDEEEPEINPSEEKK